MIFSMTGQEKCDLLRQVTAWTGLTVFPFQFNVYYEQNVEIVMFNHSTNINKTNNPTLTSNH